MAVHDWDTFMGCMLHCMQMQKQEYGKEVQQIRRLVLLQLFRAVRTHEATGCSAGIRKDCEMITCSRAQ